MNSSSFPTNPDANIIRNRCFIDIRRENDASGNRNQSNAAQHDGAKKTQRSISLEKKHLYIQDSAFIGKIKVIISRAGYFFL